MKSCSTTCWPEIELAQRLFGDFGDALILIELQPRQVGANPRLLRLLGKRLDRVGSKTSTRPTKNMQQRIRRLLGIGSKVCEQ